MQQSRLQKYSKIIICLGGMILLSVGTLAYAQSTTPDNSWNMSQWIQQIITLFSRLWVVLAMGAGKLMSNAFVYGEFMNFDVYLRQMRNISKNFANLAIGFMFLYYILKFVFQSEEVTGNEIGKKIGWFLLAWVMIQASWFMMGALLDIEQIATSAMGALPGLVIQDNNTRWQNMTKAMGSAGVLGKNLQLKKKESTNPTYLVYDRSEDAQWINTGTNSTLDAILPSHDTLSWPLYFIWFAIFQFQSYSEVPVDPSLTLKDLSRMFTATGIKFLVLTAFVVMMLILFIVNIIRIAYLWMIIALAPLIVLYIVLKKVLGIDLGSSSDGIMSKINIQTILAYIFQPTIIITFMGLMLIAVTALWQGMGPVNTTVQEYWFAINNTGVSHATFELETKWDLFSTIGDSSKGIFKNLIILGLVFALLLGIIVLSASSLKIKFIENIAESLGKTIAKIPMIPMRSAGQAWNNILKDTIWIDLASPSNRGKLDMKWDNALRELMGLPSNNTSKDDNKLRKLKASISAPESYFSALREWRDLRGVEWIPLWWVRSPKWVSSSIVEFLQKNDGKLTSKYGLSNIESALGKDSEWKAITLTESNIEKYLEKDDNKNAKYLYNAIMWQAPTTVNTATAKTIMNGAINFATKKPDTKPTSTTS